MKRILYLLFALFLTATGCEMIVEPRADFDASALDVETYENVQFYNTSYHATDYEWDFGDGYVAYVENPVHSFTHPGIYTVRLAAYYHERVDYAYATVHVYDPTVLNIQVLEYYDHYPVQGASILVYPTYRDWANETNSVAEVYTDKNGIALVNGLAEGSYFLDIWEQHHNNYSLANEDISFIQTPPLVYGRTTYFTAYVDYIPPSSASLKSGPVSRRSSAVLLNKNRKFQEMTITK